MPISKSITRQELIKKYIDFFKSKHHHEIPGASLIPENDPTVLFTTAGMHPLVPFLLGQKHPLGKRIVDVQKCIRTQDIDEVGDASHLTFFEMLGNWSLGDYFKKEAIEYSFEFLTKILGIPIEKLAITCYSGNKKLGIPRDEESAKIWLSLGISKERIVFVEDNWWGPAGETGPCGPDTEMFYWKDNSKPPPRKFNPEDENWLEFWNDVFMEYNKNKYSEFSQLMQKNVDTGMGLERILLLLNKKETVYDTECFAPVIKEIELISKKKYNKNKEDTKVIRIIADHIKAATFILGDERAVKPSNIGQGYVLRRLIRRAIRYGKSLGIKENFTSKIAKIIINEYHNYQELARNHKFIIEQLDEEENKFNLTLEKGLKMFNKIAKDKLISGRDAFLLFQSYGFPIEMTQELADEKSIKIDLEEYNKEFKRHQDLSRTSSGGQFKSGLSDESEQTRKLHTATHLLNEALRIVLKDKNIKQKGSNITPERLRFDFNFSRKLTDDELKQIEEWINARIKEALPIIMEEIPLNQAIKSGAQAEFGAKYPELVSVHTIGKSAKNYISKEICTGPHVDNTKELGKFKIQKEESSAAGVRRIKAILEINSNL